MKANGVAIYGSQAGPFKRAPEFKPTLTVDELIAKAVEAVGGEAALRKHKTLRASVDLNFEHQGVQGEGVIYAKAPDAAAQEITVTALGKKLGALHDFFDGTQGGEEATFFPFEPKSGKALEDTRIASYFYAPLDWKGRFKTAELKRIVKVGEEDAYVVIFTPEKGNADSIVLACYEKNVPIFCPAFSDCSSPFFLPNGRVLVFAERLQGNMQIRLRNTGTGKTLTLTGGNCNNYAPAWSGSNEIVFASDCRRGQVNSFG